MKKFIKALEDKGIMKNIVKSYVMTEKQIGSVDCEEAEEGMKHGLNLILDVELIRDDELCDIFFEEIREIGTSIVCEHVKRLAKEKSKETINVDVISRSSLENIVKKIVTDLMKSEQDDCK